MSKPALVFGFPRLTCGALLCCWVAGPFNTAAQLVATQPAVSASAEASGADSTSAGAVQAVEKKLAEARASLGSAASLGDAALTNAPAGASLQDIASRRALLQRLVRLFEQQLSNTAELEATKNRRAELARQAQAWTRFPDPPPYSVLLIDRLRESLQTERAKLKSGETTADMLEQLSTENRTSLSQAEEKIRQLQERLEQTADPGASARLSWQYNLERLRSQVAAATVAVLDSERQLRQEALAESRTRVAWLQRQLATAEAEATFTQADLDKVTLRIQNESAQLETELAQTETRARAALETVDTARSELRRAQAGPQAAAAGKALAAEVLAAREAQLETAQTAVRLLRVLLETESVERAMWETRFAVYRSPTVGGLMESHRRLVEFTRRAALWNDFQRQQLDASPRQIELQESHIRDLPPDSELMPFAMERLATLRERDQLLLRLMRRIEQVQRLGARWAEGLRDAEGHLSLVGRARNLFSNAGSLFEKLWRFELFAAEDTIVVEGQKITGRRSVTLGKITMAVLILVIGIWLTGLISRLAEPIIIRRLKIEANQARLIRRWFRAFLLVCLAMFSLISVKIPLTVFAFAGGALAIGLGFGMQTLLKNFVSGLILLFERPFRVGDVLEVGGQRGTVTEIGLRSSVLQLWDGTETLIPNSSLLENNVSNWTYSSPKVRFSVTVGAAYGSDTRRVAQLLAEIAERHGLVEKEPKPQVLFTEFADSALTFQLRYWVDVIKANSAQVGSDLLQMIAGAFAENGIVIAFPQRDVNLNLSRPVPVQLVAPPDTPVSGSQALSGGRLADRPAPSGAQP